MKKRPDAEMQIDDQTIMYADIEVNGSIYTAENVLFIYYIEGDMEVDIWPVMPQAYREHYLEKFIEHCKRQRDFESDFGKGEAV